MMDVPCPGKDRLGDFAAARLANAEHAALAAHIESCPACVGMLARTRSLAGSFDAELRLAATTVSGDGSPSSDALAWPDSVLGRARADEAKADGAWTAFPLRPRTFGQVPFEEREIRELLRRRLFLLACIGTFLALGNLYITEFSNIIRIADGGTRSQLGRVVVAIEMAALGALLHYQHKLGMRGLRAIEIAMVLTYASVNAWKQHYLLLSAPPGGFDSLRHGTAYVVATNLFCVIGWFLMIVCYGVLVPNTWRRTAVVTAILTVVPCLIIFDDAARSPHVRANLFTLLGYTGIVLIVADGLACFGSFKISTLQGEAFEARRLGHYQLKQPLGAGGMGAVFLAEHRLLKRPCAVKLIRPERAGNPYLLRRFEREVQAISRLRHFNTVEIFDYGLADDGTLYYVMEYLPGLNLAELVTRHGPLPPARVTHLIRQLCGALREAHGIGLVHRDIKPGNVIVGYYGGSHDVAKLLDFGLVSSRDNPAREANLTYEGAILGTPEYMAPEQADGAEFADARSDLYSLGAVAYFLLSGRPPFHGSSLADLLHAHRHLPVPPLRDVAPYVPDDLADIVLRCLAKTPTERFDGAEELEHALARCRCANGWSQEQAAAWWVGSGEGSDGVVRERAVTVQERIAGNF